MILVEPMIQGNIGAVARAMKNFDVTELKMVIQKAEEASGSGNEIGANVGSADGPITEEARKRAVHAQDILTNAQVFPSFDEAIEDLDLKIATTGVVPDNQKRHLRSHLELGEFVERAWEFDGKVGLIFGRENFGLLNPEIEKCDIVLSIPTSEAYPILNLSHAVSTVLYHVFIEGRKHRGESRPKRDASDEDRERLFERIDTMLERVNFPEHKRANTSVMIRRILGRAFVSRWEFHTLMGIISRIEFTIGKPRPIQWFPCPKCRTSIPITTEKRPLTLTCPKCRASGTMYKS